MKLILLLWRRYTLLCILALTSLPLMLLGWRCRDTVYGEYDLDPLREPALSLVFEGVHDGIYPFKDIIESGKRPREEASEDGENVPGGGEAAEDADPEGADLPDAAGTVRDGESAAEIAASYEEAGDSAVEKLEALPQNAIRGDADKIPDGVCNPVMQAEQFLPAFCAAGRIAGIAQHQGIPIDAMAVPFSNFTSPDSGASRVFSERRGLDEDGAVSNGQGQVNRFCSAGCRQDAFLRNSQERSKSLSYPLHFGIRIKLN